MKLLRTAIVLSSLFVAAACSSTSTTNSKAMNATCPVSGKAITAENPTTSFDGKTIGFCCDNCVSKFNGMPTADKQAKVTGSMPAK